MSELLKCIIVDDEPPAIRLLSKYSERVSFIEVVNTFTNPLEALRYIESENIDVIFLDIQMPELTGIQLSKIINDKVKIIFTTAYPQFALESYDVNTSDYLLKPIEFDRFYKAVSKIQLPEQNNNVSPTTSKDFIFIKTDGKNNFVKVFFEDILFIESLKNYISINLKDKQIISYNTLKNTIENLPNNFIQIHKSFAVSIDKIEKITNDSIWVNQKELPIGNTYKKFFFEKISSNKL